MVLEVVGLDVEHDRGRGSDEQERAVALVGLDDGELTGTEVGVLARLVQVAADGEGRVDAAGLRGDDEQRGRRRLAVRAGDRDAAPVLERGGERGRAAQHALAAAARRDELLVVGVDRRGVDEGVGVVEVLRRVADPDVGAEGPQAGDGQRVARLAAAHRQPALEQDAGQRAHPRPGDPHDVHPAELGQRAGRHRWRRCARARLRVRPSRRAARRRGRWSAGSRREPPVLGRHREHAAGQHDVGVARAGLLGVPRTSPRGSRGR